MRQRRSLLATLLVAGAVISIGLRSEAAHGADSWGAPVDVARDTGRPSDFAVNARGDAIAVWESAPLDDATFVARAAVRPAGKGWRASRTLSRAGTQIDNPRVALDARGGAVVVWSRGRRSRGFLTEAAVLTPGGRWRSPEILGRGQSPAVAVTPQGDALAAWGPALRVAERRGGRWRSLTNPPGARRAERPRVAINARGDAALVWDVSGRTLTRVYGSARRQGGSLDRVRRLSGASYDAVNPEVGIDERGAISAAWLRSTTRENDGAKIFLGEVETALRSPGAEWASPEIISPRGGSAYSLTLTVNPRGEAIAAWLNGTDEQRTAEVSLRPLGGQWEPPRVLGPAGTDPPAIAIGPFGHAAAVWRSGDAQVQGAVRPPVGSWGEARPISGPRCCGDPYVGVDAAGLATALWRDNRLDVLRASSNDIAGGG